jgi:ankyrin repeat protein
MSPSAAHRYRSGTLADQAAGGERPLSGELLRWLEAHKFPPDVDAPGGNRVTPLMKAARTGNAVITAELLRAGARVNARNADGNNALWFACTSDSPGIIAMLLEAGIHIDNRNGNGATSLMYAASTGKVAVLELLLLAGADQHIRTLDGLSALDMCAAEDCRCVLRGV